MLGLLKRGDKKDKRAEGSWKSLVQAVLKDGYLKYALNIYEEDSDLATFKALSRRVKPIGEALPEAPVAVTLELDAAHNGPLGLKFRSDGKIEKVAKSSWASHWGMQVGDEILAIDGRPPWYNDSSKNHTSKLGDVPAPTTQQVQDLVGPVRITLRVLEQPGLLKKAIQAAYTPRDISIGVWEADEQRRELRQALEAEEQRHEFRQALNDAECDALQPWLAEQARAEISMTEDVDQIEPKGNADEATRMEDTNDELERWREEQIERVIQRKQVEAQLKDKDAGNQANSEPREQPKLVTQDVSTMFAKRLDQERALMRRRVFREEQRRAEVRAREELRAEAVARAKELGQTVAEIDEVQSERQEREQEALAEKIQYDRILFQRELAEQKQQQLLEKREMDKAAREQQIAMQRQFEEAQKNLEKDRQVLQEIRLQEQRRFQQELAQQGSQSASQSRPDVMAEMQSELEDAKRRIQQQQHLTQAHDKNREDVLKVQQQRLQMETNQMQKKFDEQRVQLLQQQEHEHMLIQEKLEQQRQVLASKAQTDERLRAEAKTQHQALEMEQAEMQRQFEETKRFMLEQQESERKALEETKLEDQVRFQRELENQNRQMALKAEADKRNREEAIESSDQKLKAQQAEMLEFEAELQAEKTKKEEDAQEAYLEHLGEQHAKRLQSKTRSWQDPANEALSLHNTDPPLVVGDQVKVLENMQSNCEEAYALPAGTLGIIREFDDDGDALVNFQDIPKFTWISQGQMHKLIKAKGNEDSRRVSVFSQATHESESRNQHMLQTADGSTLPQVKEKQKTSFLGGAGSSNIQTQPSAKKRMSANPMARPRMNEVGAESLAAANGNTSKTDHRQPDKRVGKSPPPRIIQPTIHNESTSQSKAKDDTTTEFMGKADSKPPSYVFGDAAARKKKGKRHDGRSTSPVSKEKTNNGKKAKRNDSPGRALVGSKRDKEDGVATATASLQPDEDDGVFGLTNLFGVEDDENANLESDIPIEGRDVEKDDGIFGFSDLFTSNTNQSSSAATDADNHGQLEVSSGHQQTGLTGTAPSDDTNTQDKIDGKEDDESWNWFGEQGVTGVPKDDSLDSQDDSVFGLSGLFGNADGQGDDREKNDEKPDSEKESKQTKLAEDWVAPNITDDQDDGVFGLTNLLGLGATSDAPDELLQPNDKLVPPELAAQSIGGELNTNAPEDDGVFGLTGLFASDIQGSDATKEVNDKVETRVNASDGIAEADDGVFGLTGLFATTVEEIDEGESTHEQVVSNNKKPGLMARLRPQKKQTNKSSNMPSSDATKKGNGKVETHVNANDGIAEPDDGVFGLTGLFATTVEDSGEEVKQDVSNDKKPGLLARLRPQKKQTNKPSNIQGSDATKKGNDKVETSVNVNDGIAEADDGVFGLTGLFATTGEASGEGESKDKQDVSNKKKTGLMARLRTPKSQTNKDATKLGEVVEDDDGVFGLTGVFG